MAIEFKEVNDWLDIKADNFEDWKKAFSAKYATEQQFLENKELVKKLTGTAFGNIDSAIVQIGRAQGIEFTLKEIEEMKIEDKVNYLFEKQGKSLTDQITELKASASKTGDDKVKEWEEKYSKMEGKLKDYQAMTKKQAEDFEKQQAEFGSKIKGVKLEYVNEKLWGGINYAPGTNDLQKRGFRSLFESKYKIDLDEKGMEYIADQSGNRIPNPQKHSEFLTPADVLKMELGANNLDIKNPNAGRPYTPPPPTTTGQGQFGNVQPVPQPTQVRSRIHDRAVKAAGG